MTVLATGISPCPSWPGLCAGDGGVWIISAYLCAALQVQDHARDGAETSFLRCSCGEREPRQVGLVMPRGLLSLLVPPSPHFLPSDGKYGYTGG